jgi:hypothetical protein
MERTVQIVARVVAFVAFVYLARAFWGFVEVDGCLDDGGAVHEGICLESRHGQWSLASSRPFVAWFVALGLPAIVVTSMYACLNWLWRTARTAKRNSNA